MMLESLIMEINNNYRRAGNLFNNLISYIHYIKYTHPTHNRCYICVTEFLDNDEQILILKNMIENDNMKCKEHTEMDKTYLTITWDNKR